MLSPEDEAIPNLVK
ncbi:unnamed protein product, partial [Allacma fusca]